MTEWTTSKDQILTQLGKFCGILEHILEEEIHING